MPPRDNSHHLKAAQARRREEKLAAVRAAIERLATKGTALSFQSVATEAGVARSWLYAVPELRADIESRRSAGPVPVAQKVSEDSSVALLSLAKAEVQRLRFDNRRLRKELAEALGQIRTLRGG
jgi:hypothetical protein